MNPHGLIYRSFGIAILSVSICSSQTVEAQIPFDVRYEAPVECPNRDDFMTAFRGRLNRSSAPNTQPELLSNTYLAVYIRAKGIAYEGQVDFTFSDGKTKTRTFEDGQCTALVEALALVSAMELDPSSPTTQEPSGKPPTPSTITQGHAFPIARIASGKPAPYRHFEFLVSGVVGLHTAPAPSTLVTPGLYFGLQPTSAAYSVGLTVNYGHTSTIRYDGGDVRFRWGTAALFACPVSVNETYVSLSFCAETEVGILRAEPKRTVNAAVQNSLWLAPGLGGLSAFNYQRLRVELYTGAQLPLIRDRYTFAKASPEVVHRPSWLGLTAELRLGWTL